MENTETQPSKESCGMVSLPFISALRREKQDELCELVASFIYIMSSRLASVTY